VVLALYVRIRVLPVQDRPHLASPVQLLQIECQLQTVVAKLDIMKQVLLVPLVLIRVLPVQDRPPLASPVQLLQIGYLQLIVLV